MRKRKDLSKANLYSSVKELIELDAQHVHLPQCKLYTLFSIAFQYFLFNSLKKNGVYVIRIENHPLALKLARNAKDESTRKIMDRLILPRKFVYGKSTFYLDFFHLNSWGMVNEIPRNLICGALIVKGTQDQPFQETKEGESPETPPTEIEQATIVGTNNNINPELPKDYFYYSLQDFVPQTIVISHQGSFENTLSHNISYVCQIEQDRPIVGVKLGKGFKLEDED